MKMICHFSLSGDVEFLLYETIRLRNASLGET
jgi:hypothetical protein